MPLASSLSNRIFVACFLLATLSLGFAFAFVNENVTRQAEAELRRGLAEAAALVEQQRTTTLTDTLTRDARLVADLPKLKAGVSEQDPPTVQPIADDYRREMGADLLVISGSSGDILASSGASSTTLPARATAPHDGEYASLVPHPRGLLQVISVPIRIEPSTQIGGPELLGRLTVGVFLDRERALQFKRVASGSEVAFAAGGRILASSVPPEWHDRLRSVATAAVPTAVTLDDTEYLAVARPMGKGAVHRGIFEAGDATVLVLRSKSEGLRFLSTLRAGLGGALLVAVLLATVASFAVARTITRPLAAVTGAMAHVAATGDLTRRVSVRSSAWDDADARLLATAFNTLTESIARFKREEAQRDRLSSLGRLSTVIAHEIRNPLMIIRASLRTLRREHVNPEDLREAVADIDDETTRLNRIVTEVLDFAKPMRFDLAEADVNEICRASASAAYAGDPGDEVALELDPHLPPIVTDAERLRTALVNVLTNARYAVKASADAAPQDRAPGTGHASEGPAVTVRTRCTNDRITITVADRGIGIAADDLPHVFDPYFTTRRTGTGLGLPIAKNVVEGLGGSITAHSRPGEGTEIAIELPVERGVAAERPRPASEPASAPLTAVLSGVRRS